MGMLGELQQSEPRLDRVRRGCASFCDALRRRTPLLVIWALYVLFMGLTPYYFGSQLLGVCFWLREAGIFGVVIFVAFLACWVTCFLPELPGALPRPLSGLSFLSRARPQLRTGAGSFPPRRSYDRIGL